MTWNIACAPSITSLSSDPFVVTAAGVGCGGGCLVVLVAGAELSFRHHEDAPRTPTPEPLRAEGRPELLAPGVGASEVAPEELSTLVRADCTCACSRSLDDPDAAASGAPSQAAVRLPLLRKVMGALRASNVAGRLPNAHSQRACCTPTITTVQVTA